MRKITTEELTKIEKLIDIGNKAKNNNNYMLANICIVAIFDVLKEELKLEKKSDEVMIIYERSGTQKYDGLYYDLVGVKVRKKYLCIPVPLIKHGRLIDFAHLFEFVNRFEHSREIKTYNDIKIDSNLYKKLFNLISPYKVRAVCINYIYDSEGIFHCLLCNNVWVHQTHLWQKRNIERL